MEHPLEERTKVTKDGFGHMTKVAAMAINSQKALKNLLFQNRNAYDFKTLHKASGNGAIQSLYKS